MSCHKTSWPVACPRRRDGDGRPLVPCEFRAHVHDARCVAITGTMLVESERLVMTQQGHDWLARLLLTPGRYTARVHVVRATLGLPGQNDPADSWDVTFDVPEVQGDPRHTVELRLWLHHPFYLNSLESDHHEPRRHAD